MMDEVGRQRWRREKREAALNQDCPAKSCAAKRGQPCRTRSGVRVTWFHTGRVDKGLRQMGRLVT